MQKINNFLLFYITLVAQTFTNNVSNSNIDMSKIMENFGLHWNYEILAIDESKVLDYNKFIDAFISKDSSKIIHTFNSMKNDWDLEKAKKSSYSIYQSLIISSQEEYKDWLSLIPSCESYADPDLIKDKNFYTDVNQDIMIGIFFHYFLNGTDSLLWCKRPFYYLNESLISEQQLEILYNTSFDFKLKTRKFEEYDKWKEISYSDIKKLFIEKSPSNKLDEFFQNYFRMCIEKKFKIIINTSFY